MLLKKAKQNNIKYFFNINNLPLLNKSTFLFCRSVKFCYYIKDNADRTNTFILTAV